jgi:formylglycine-generating enzyme required for sulfatase activity
MNVGFTYDYWLDAVAVTQGSYREVMGTLPPKIQSGSSAIPFPHLTDSISVDSYAWYSFNSNGQTHEAGTKIPNAFGLYDMAGNAYQYKALHPFLNDKPFYFFPIGGRLDNLTFA